MDLRFGSVNFVRFEKTIKKFLFKKVSKKNAQFTFGIHSSTDVTKRASVEITHFSIPRIKYQNSTDIM